MKKDVSKLIEKIEDFFNSDFRLGIKELRIIDEDKNYLLDAKKKLDTISFGYYEIKCDIYAELEQNKNKNKLSIQFDKNY